MASCEVENYTVQLRCWKTIQVVSNEALEAAA